MNNFLNKAIEIASSYDVSTPVNGLVLYSVSFLPSKENREKAFQFVKEHKATMTIENTACGSKLLEIGLNEKNNGLTEDEISLVWEIASKRMIEKASGEITAFVDGADARSIFCKVELISILKNPLITVINNEEKHTFASKYFKPVFE